MNGKEYKAVTIVAPDTQSHTLLAEAFNAWVQAERPSAIVHVHYYHDLEAHVRGYQVIYMESAHGQEQHRAGLKPAAPTSPTTLPA